MMAEAVRTIIEWVGEDPDREGLRDTPGRVERSFSELCSGYQLTAEDVLSRKFDVWDGDGVKPHDGMVILRDIELYSLCEHHLLPFVGRAHIAYIPGAQGHVVGISKLARLVDVYARRLQIQERLTAQIADAIEKHLKAKGVMVVIEARHFCMLMRGCSKQNSVMTTSELRGLFWDNASARAETLQLFKGTP
jgi:GTP cyclohydrolase I